ncbi:MAG TPA: hypothetical protein VM510_04005 [Caulifigura sp.]|jgi:hypothetical protein|nr:hypothetical protein [Caulifigura sp.]
MAASDDDWRLQGQENYLHGAVLTWAEYRTPSPQWDHDHCEFCGAKFADTTDVMDAQLTGFVTANQRWICRWRAHDMQERFYFVLMGEPLT